MPRGFNPKWILGRTIVAVEMNPRLGRNGGTQMAHDPVIRLDNGATLQFHVEETDDLMYGVDILYNKPL